MKVIVDVNLSAAWVSFLQDRGHEAEHWSRIGAHDAGDKEIMTYCANAGAVILTGDMDFSEMHAFEGTSHPSVIQLRAKDMLPSARGAEVARALAIAASHLALGAIVTIKSSRMRVVKLPIGTTEPR